VITPPDRDPMLTDLHPLDRAVRTRDLLASDIPEEREVGKWEVEALMATTRAAALRDPETVIQALYEMAKLARPAGWSEPQAPTLPDASWRAAGTCYVARVRGHVLVVRESGTRRGSFYSVVDGHHLSAHGGPTDYGHLLDAMIAAEAAVDPAASAERAAHIAAETGGPSGGMPEGTEGADR
jgi:hypothetical protein